MFWRPNSSKFTPPYDVIELAGKIIVMVEVAGMSASDLKISLSRDRLVVTGIRHRPNLDSQAAHHRVEIGFGEFRLEVPLSWSVEQGLVSASYRDGFLQIELPRHTEKRIRINNLEKQQDETADDE